MAVDGQYTADTRVSYSRLRKGVHVSNSIGVTRVKPVIGTGKYTGIPVASVKTTL